MEMENGYIAMRTVNFNGVEYVEGSEIPADAVLPSRIPTLLASKTIVRKETAKTGDETVDTAEFVNIPVIKEDGVFSLSVRKDDVAKAIGILQLKKEEAVAAVSQVLSKETLMVVDACTKTLEVKKAIRERVSVLDSMESVSKGEF